MVSQNMLNNPNINIIAQMGNVSVLEFNQDMSVTPLTSKQEYYSAQMNVKKRQVMIQLNNDEYVLQSGAMQWISGNVNIKTGVKGAGDFLGKLVKAKVTKESAIKPVYSGAGTLVLEPTYRHILLTDVSSWGGQIVLDDGLFLACQNTLQQKVVARSNASSALLGKEGLFNLSLVGSGIAVLESIVPMAEIIEVTLDNDVMKIDGNMAIAWSGSLDFTVEKSTKSLIGSAASGEGFVNVYRGSGKIWLAPVMASDYYAGQQNTVENSDQQNTADTVSDAIDVVSSIVDIFS